MALRLQAVCDVCGRGHPRGESIHLSEPLTARGEAARDGWWYNEGGAVTTDVCPECLVGVGRGERRHA